MIRAYMVVQVLHISFCLIHTIHTYDRQLVIAAQKGDLEKVRELATKRYESFSNGRYSPALADVNALVAFQTKLKTTALSQAAQEGHIPVVLELLEKKADPNVPRSNGVTALILAAEQGHAAVAEILLWAKAAVRHCADKEELGVTALTQAVQRGHADTVKGLLKAKAWVNQARADKATSLHIAVSQGHTRIAQILLEAGASKKMKDTFGHVPIQYAKTNRMQKLLQKRVPARKKQHKQMQEVFPNRD